MRIFFIWFCLLFCVCLQAVTNYTASQFIADLYPALTDDTIITFDVPMHFIGSVQPFVFSGNYTLTLKTDPANPTNAYILLDTTSTLNIATLTANRSIIFQDTMQLRMRKGQPGISAGAIIAAASTPPGGSIIFQNQSNMITVP
ncbi:MAG: hypothetical protein UU47_C0023G0005 [candidate division TM6 bacterium GW2011_GWE2_41_16]|nr:MAG: hypothetical protein UU47_C0023G0005 [candidate division TM6 bacterium GW2011_GWE2_41_16]